MKSNQIKQLFLLIALVCYSTVSAYDFKSNGFFYNKIGETGSTCEVTYEYFRETTYSGNVVIPETVSYGGTEYTVTRIGYCAFYGCQNISSVTLPETIREIDSGAFGGCERLPSISLPSALTTIGASAFAGCSSLTSVEIPNSVTLLESSAFKNCTGLVSVTLPESIKAIPYSCFYGCSSLMSITIPASVTDIASSALRDCVSLTEINCWALNPPALTERTFQNVPVETCFLNVPAPSIAAYSATEYWKNFQKILPLSGTEEETNAINDIMECGRVVENDVIQILTIDGKFVEVTNVQYGKMQLPATLKRGAYILKNGNKTAKIILK